MIKIAEIKAYDETNRLDWTKFSKENESILNFLKLKLSYDSTILVALDGMEVVGILVASDFDLPFARTIDLIEVLEGYRSRGIGTAILNKLIFESETLYFLTVTSEEKYKEKLLEFYKRFGFKLLSDNPMTSPVMAYIPRNLERLKIWKVFIEKTLNEYSYNRYKSTAFLPIWGRPYAPWLNFVYDIYMPLSKEIQSILEHETNLN